MTTLVLERDAGFCSGGDEDEGFYSHTDASDDSADVKVRGVSLLRNKRKCSEPRRLDTELPAKKRKLDLLESKTSPFRPWSGSPPNVPSIPASTHSRLPSKVWLSTPRPLLEEKPPFSLTVPVPQLLLTTPHLIPTQSRLLVQQEEPLSLVSKKKETKKKEATTSQRNHSRAVETKSDQIKCERTTNEAAFKMDSILSLVKTDRTCVQSSSESPKSKASQQMQQRNYKNMTRERRIEANARERTRVHTISAAFDTLRHSIPAYSHNQKLSKLSVLRIACSYIMTLSRLSGQDYSEDQSEPALAECVSNVSRTIQTEGKIRKKKDD